MSTPRQTRRKYIKTIGVASAAGLAGCLGGDDEFDEGPVQLGSVQPLSGPFAAYGELYLQAVEFAIDEINENDGVLGMDLELNNIDTGSDPRDAASAVSEHVEGGASAILGPVDSDAGIRVAQEVEDLEVPHFPNQAATPELLSRDSRYTFRVGALPAPWWENAHGRFVQESGADKIGALIADFSYGRAVEAGINEFLKPVADVTLEATPPPGGTDDFTGFVRRLPEDMVTMDLIGHPGGIGALQATAQLGVEPDRTLFPNLPVTAIWGAVGERAADQVQHFNTIDPESETYQEVSERFADETSTPFGPVAAYGYATVKLIAAAVEEAGTADPVEVRDTVTGMSFDTVLTYPLEWTEWGELANPRAVGLEYVASEADFSPGTPFHMQKFWTSDTFEVLNPEEW